MATKTITPKIGLQNLMLDAATEMKSFPVAMGFQMADGVLCKIAHRAIDLNDAELIELCKSICLIPDN
jgi:hypothetical protein